MPQSMSCRQCAVKFDFGFAARVRIWKDTGEPLDVIFGNGWGRNFLFLSFKEQTNHSPNDYEKVASGNYSAPPMGMSNRLTVVLQQELH